MFEVTCLTQIGKKVTWADKRNEKGLILQQQQQQRLFRARNKANMDLGGDPFLNFLHFFSVILF